MFFKFLSKIPKLPHNYIYFAIEIMKKQAAKFEITYKLRKLKPRNSDISAKFCNLATSPPYTRRRA